ncbi:MAG TPA: glutaredoxin family protein [Casimicrobiaceae bacterium]|nr:glutaredoxin family protein [Casimicrobiaceae bacterium]
MARSNTSRLRSIVALVAATIAAGALAQQQVYRYTDPEGRVVYSDRPPMGAAKDVQPKRLGANFIENDALPLAAREASQNYPVTLYTFNCGQICASAEGLLNKRGIPFTPVNVEEAKGAERLKALTGEMTAPVLQVGDKLVAKGFNEAKWQSLLDEAGYPKTLPPRTARPAAPKPEPAPASPQAKPVAPGGGYPKN